MCRTWTLVAEPVVENVLLPARCDEQQVEIAKQQVEIARLVERVGLLVTKVMVFGEVVEG